MPIVETTVIVNAPVDTVLAVARDYSAYPSFMKDVKSVDVLESDGSRVVTKWVARVEEVKMEIKWTEEDVWNLPDRSSHFRQTSGDYKKMEGDWRFIPDGDKTRFESKVDVEFNIPLVGALIKTLIAKKVKENLDAMQVAIKTRAEELAAS